MTRPCVARVCDYYLGGSRHFESDRAVGWEALKVVPDLPRITRDHRDLLRRVVLGIGALVGDLTVIDPGVVPIPRCRPEPGDDVDSDVGDDYPRLAGVGRRD